MSLTTKIEGFHPVELAIYASLIGAILGDIIPTVGDAGYFWYVRKQRNKLESGEITAKQYWTRDAIAYYTFNSMWWLLLLIIVAYFAKGHEDKTKILMGLIGAGIVAAVLIKNIKSDTEKFNAKTEAPV